MGSEQQETSVAADPVGQQLQRAREAKGLSVSAVADQQHLRASIIQAIEAGDYSKIDTELFLKGYVRAYARQVDLDGDALIQDLDAELAPIRQQREDEQQAHPLANIERRRERKKQVAKALLVVLVLALVGYLAFHFLAQNDAGAPEEPAAGSDEQLREPDSNAEASGSDSPEAVEPLSESPAPTAFDSVDDVPVEASASDMVAPDTMEELEVPPTTVQTGELPIDSSVPAQTAQESVGVAEPELAEPDVMPAATSSVARLEMTFGDDCWIQVTDATGRRLASALRRQGDRLDVTGEPPLRVVVGAMNAVESIQFQGENLALDSFRVVNNRSEFTLEP